MSSFYPQSHPIIAHIGVIYDEPDPETYAGIEFKVSAHDPAAKDLKVNTGIPARDYLVAQAMLLYISLQDYGREPDSLMGSSSLDHFEMDGGVLTCAEVDKDMAETADQIGREQLRKLGYDVAEKHNAPADEVPPLLEDLPVGYEINIGTDTPEGRVWKGDIRKYMFSFFEELSSGFCGLGISFLEWLEVHKGWKHLELGRRFVKVVPLHEEDENDEQST